MAKEIQAKQFCREFLGAPMPDAHVQALTQMAIKDVALWFSSLAIDELEQLLKEVLTDSGFPCLFEELQAKIQEAL